MNEQMGRRIGAGIGTVLIVEVDYQGSGWGSFLRIRVEVNITKPLLSGKMINLGGKQCCTHSKYERLPNLCFKCGLLKHTNGKCPNINLVSQSQEQYGQWLRAPSAPLYSSFLRKYGGSPEFPSQGPLSQDQLEEVGDWNYVGEKSRSVDDTTVVLQEPITYQNQESNSSFERVSSPMNLSKDH